MKSSFSLPNPIAARVRLIVGAVVGIVAFFAIPQHYDASTRVVLGWDAGALAVMLLISAMVAGSTPDHMRRRAAIQDQGRWVILGIIVAAALFSVLALISIQKHAKSAEPGEAALYLAVTVATVLLAWLLLHTVFALHYAHEYYGPATDEDDEDGLIGGLEFPGEKQPSYMDFMYFSFVIGMTCQVSDVQVTGRGVRRMALAHGVVSFFFNTIILALTINIIAGMI